VPGIGLVLPRSVSVKRILRDGVSGQLDRVVDLAYRHLGMDMAFVSTFQDGRQVYRSIAGDATSFGASLGEGPDLADTYCSRVVGGQLPNVVPDSTEDPRVRDLRTTVEAGIGAYIGVPLHRPDGHVYGTFCCVSHDPAPDLGPRDVGFMSMLAEFLEEEIAAEARFDDQRRTVTDVIARRDVTMALQPIVDLTTGACTGLEALARFRGALGGPEATFAGADEVGLRPELEQMAALAAIGWRPVLSADQSLSINLSPDVACELARVLPDATPLSGLTLEITEHAAVHSYDLIRETLAPLRAKGLKLAIDDAGAGFASLRHVVELQPDIIKIDRSLVAGVETDMARRSVVTTFVLLALDIGAAIVAEGVETPSELEAVTTLGVDAVQGYLIARPSSDPAQVARWCCDETLLPDPAQARPFRTTAAGCR
jgi:EAL domain-containing protein (putative c-di-GMP-specific phosphodiesterase class I)